MTDRSVTKHEQTGPVTIIRNVLVVVLIPTALVLAVCHKNEAAFCCFAAAVALVWK